MIFLVVNIIAIIVNTLILIAGFKVVLSFVYADQIVLEFFNKHIVSINNYLNLHLPALTIEQLPYLLAATAMIIFIGIGISGPVDTILRYFYGFGRPLPDERETFDYNFKIVCEAAGKDYKKFKLYMTDDPMENACALGKNSIALTRRLIKNCTDEEIQAVLAHEVGHLHYGDTFQLRIFLATTFCGQLMMFLFALIFRAFFALGKIPIPLVNIFFLFCGGYFWILYWLCQIIFLTPMAIGSLLGMRHNEYRADRYAAKLGFSDGLNSFLYEQLENFETPKGLAAFWQTHPTPRQRINKIEAFENNKLSILDKFYGLLLSEGWQKAKSN